jgi:hypothetical protein
MIFLYSFLVGCLTAFFGWTGGRGRDYWEKHKNWPLWLLSSWTRDWLIGPICAVFAWVLGVHSLWLLLMIMATGGALSTYWDTLFGFDNFWFHGFMVGLAAFPIAIVTGHWVLWAVRCIILAVWMGGWSASIGDAHVEEAGRYFIVGSTIAMVC